jgi:hypothetical protein
MYRFTLSSFSINKAIELGRKRASSFQTHCESEKKIVPKGSQLYQPRTTLLRCGGPPQFIPAKESGAVGKNHKVSPKEIEVNLKLNAQSVGEQFVPLSTEHGALDGAGMTRIRKWRISWHASNNPDVTGYRLYWAKGSRVNYASDFAEVGKVTEVILPDDVPSFPLVHGDIEIGVTSIGRNGNESNMTVTSALFDTVAPDAPSNLKLEVL